MKIYYDSNGDGNPNQELTEIISYPDPQSRLDIVGYCTVIVRDFEGALYSTFIDLNFIACKIEDNETNVLFRGFITKKSFRYDQLTLQMKGIGVVFEWKSFTNNYIQAEGKVSSVPAGTDLVLKDNDEGDPFTWNDDQWHAGDQDKGLLIVDNSNATFVTTPAWDASNDTITGNDGEAPTIDGNYTDTLVKNDTTNILKVKEEAASLNVVIELDIDGTLVPNTNFLQKIEIDYQFGMRHDLNHAYAQTSSTVHLQIKKDTTWITVKSFGKVTSGIKDLTYQTDNPTIVIEDTHAELAKYFDEDVGENNYESLKGLRFVTSGNQDAGYAIHYTHVDYVSVRVYYNSENISPIMKKITDNGDSWVACEGVDNWTETGVSVEDSFFIGENSAQVLSDLGAEMGISISIQSTLIKYIARWFKGTNGMQVLRSICLLEGLRWFEDYINNRIVVVTPDDFTSSGVSLSQVNYEDDWEYEDNCNNYYRVEVHGCASLGIFAFAEDITVDSPMVKQINDESIMTVPDAQEVADTQFALLKVKRPSIRIPLEGVNIDLQLGTTVNLTMARPTVDAVDYPIRMIQRSKFGIDGISTIIYCGLGHSKIEEEIGTKINKALYLAKKAHTDRLISSPLSGGAVITWTDVGGRVSGVEGVITAELVNGQSIDNRIDALIAAHHGAESGDHDDRYYTETEIDAFVYVNAAGAVSAVLSDDKYVKNYENDVIDGTLTTTGLICNGNISVNIGSTVDGVDISVHAADNDAHHVKYTNAEAVQAVASADDYLKNSESDAMVGTFTATGLIINGNISLTGTVDGVDVALLKTNHDNLQTDVDGFQDELKDLTQVEIQQLENIGDNTISNAQWGYVGVLNQNLRQADTPTFGGLIANGNIQINIGSTVDGVDISEHVANATAHQDAPTLITTHAGDDNAHHEVFESLVEDLSPQLGGNLDLNAKDIKEGAVILYDISDRKLNPDKILLSLGSTIDKFDSDVALAGDNTDVPTSLAVKTYVDNIDKYTQAEVNGLIATHHLSTSTDHDDRYYTEAETYTQAQVNALIPSAGDFLHNSLDGLNAGDVYEHISQAQKDALHTEQHAMDNATYHTSSDIVTLNSSTTKHGFLKKLDNNALNFMNGQGIWAEPAGAGGVSEATLHALLGIGIENAYPVNFILAYPSASTNMRSYTGILIQSLASGDCLLQLKEPTNRYGKKLYINKILIGLNYATVSIYLNEIRLYGITQYNSKTQILYDGTNYTAPAEVEYSGGSFPYDLSSYKSVVIQVGYTGSSVKIYYVIAEVYYDD